MEEQSFTLSNRLDQIEAVQDEIKYVLQTRGVRLKQIRAILLALGEWLEAVVLHAYDDNAEHQIEVGLSVGEDEVRVCVSDDGREFELNDVSAPDPEQPVTPRNLTGQALQLIRSLMDQVEYQRRDGKNQFTMIKQIIPLS